MKKEKIKRWILALLLLVSAAGIAITYKKPLAGHISAFQYRRGHAWTGYQVLAIVEENGNCYAVSSWEPGMMENVYHEGPKEGRILLTEEQSEIFDKLCLKNLRLPEWKEYYWPKEMRTDQPGWGITYTWNGTEYTTGGYDTYPDGLTEIGQFFGELFPIESYTPQLSGAVIKRVE